MDVALPIGPLEESVSVTSAATDVLPSQIGAPVTVLDSKTLEILGKTDVLEALRLVPGASLVETGGKGGATSMFIRGGNANFNKVLIDGIPANDIGGGIDLVAVLDGRRGAYRGAARSQQRHRRHRCAGRRDQHHVPPRPHPRA